MRCQASSYVCKRPARICCATGSHYLLIIISIDFAIDGITRPCLYAAVIYKL